MHTGTEHTILRLLGHLNPGASDHAWTQQDSKVSYSSGESVHTHTHIHTRTQQGSKVCSSSGESVHVSTGHLGKLNL